MQLNPVAPAAANELDIRLVDTFDIYVADRGRKELGDISELATDIRENGLLHPPTVRPPNEEELAAGVTQSWVLITGGRRYGAMVSLGWLKIPVSVRETMNALRHRIIELNENIKRKQLTWQEEAFFHQEIVQLRQEVAAQEGKKITQADIAYELGVNPGTISRSVAAAEAMQKSPGLAKSSSRKSALRAAETAKFAERATVEGVMADQRSKAVQTIQKAVVTADARNFIRTIPSKSVDLVLTDPPFGIDYFSQGHKVDEKGIAEYDDSPEVMKDLMYDLVPQWMRVLRETGWLMVFMGEEGMPILRDLVDNCCLTHNDYRWQYDPEIDGDMEPKAISKKEKFCISALEEPQDGWCRFAKAEPKPWIWYRKNSRNRPRYPERHAQNMYESILVVNMGKGRLNYACSNVIEVEAEYGEERFHPNQKPVELGKILTSRVCGIGDSVVDTTYGSGALLAGASKMACYVYGSEKNEDLRGPALGLIAKHRMSIASRAKDISAERYTRALNRPVAGVTDFTEIEVENEEQEELDGA